MQAWWARGLGLGFAIAGALLWAVNLTSLQPLTEPAKPWHDVYGGNNTYWARDLRWIAVVAVFLALVLAFQGAPIRSAVVATVVVGWLGADIALDRADFTGADAQVRSSLVAFAGVGACWLLALPRAARPNRTVLIVAAFLAAALASVAALAEGPRAADPPQLHTASALTAVLLVAIAMACALAAAPQLDRASVSCALGVTTAYAAVVLLGGPPTRKVGALALGGVVALAAATVIHGLPQDRAAAKPWLGAALACTVAYPFVLYTAASIVILAVPDAAPFTQWAGNPPINSADEDVLLAVPGLIMGGVLYAGLLAFERAVRNGRGGWLVET